MMNPQHVSNDNLLMVQRMCNGAAKDLISAATATLEDEKFG